MHHAKIALLAAAGLSLAIVGCNQKPAETNAAQSGGDGTSANDGLANTASADASDPVASAMSAAPEAIAKDATIMQAQADGSMKTASR